MPRVTEEHRAARREQIILAAMRVVAVEGFHKTTMADVVRESGLSAGAVYGYFRSKEELIGAIAGQAGGLISGVVGQMLTQDPVPAPPETLRLLTTLVVQRAQIHGIDLTRIAVNGWAEAVRDEAVRRSIAGQFHDIRAQFALLVTAMQEAGHIDPDGDPQVAARTLFGLLPGFILQRLLLGDVTPESYAEGFAALQPARHAAAQPAGLLNR